jgi:uncharacterized membrane protein
MVLPAGTTLPPLPYLLGVLLAVGAVALGLRQASVRLTGRAVLALSPWMMAGAGLYVLYQIEVVPPALVPLFGSPTVYAVTFVVAGLVWLGALQTRSTEAVLAAGGVLAALVPWGAAIGVGVHRGSLSPTWPLIGVVIALVLGAIVWWVFAQATPEHASTVGAVGPLVIVSHALDGVSTAIGIDVLGFAEQTPLSRIVLEVAGALPTAPVLGVGWLFVVVKLAVAAVVVWLLADYVADDPPAGYALLLLVASVGLGPGAHNVLLFMVLGPAGI